MTSSTQRRDVASGASESEADSMFEVRAGLLDVGAFHVRSLRGREAISECFRFDVEFSSPLDPEVLKAGVLGRSTRLTIGARSETPRIIDGITSLIRQSGREMKSDRLYELRIVPALWVLRRGRNSRVFQDLTVVQVVDEVLKHAKIPCRWALTRKYPRLTYCVQYRESDYAFITRILATAGIFFYFEPAPDDARSSAAAVQSPVVFCDTVEGYSAIEHGSWSIGVNVAGLMKLTPASKATASGAGTSPMLKFRPHDFDAPTDDSFVAAFDLEDRVRSKTATVHEYDFRRPMLTLAAGTSGALSKLGDVMTAIENVSGAIGGVSNAVSSASDVGGAVLDGGPTGGGNAWSGLGDAADAAGGIADTASDLASGIASVADSVTSLVGLASGAGASGGARASHDDNWFEVYEHHGEYEDPALARTVAHTLLERHRVDAVRGKGTSRCTRLAPGYRFTLDEHAESGFNQEYVISEIIHRGTVPSLLDDTDPAPGDRATRRLYENRFSCVPSSIPLRSKDRPRKVQQVVEVAAVTGPGHEEIHTDEFGRIKVRFPWDRVGPHNDRSSCWIRVTQSWAGANWGAQFVPRVGMEVLVSFVGGDVDRPVVTGCLYNGTHPTPFELPGDKTRSGWRTASTPGGGGHNELSFEDRRGGEQVYLHAQRDHDEVVLRNHTSTVHGDETNRVDHNQADSVLGHRVRDTRGDEHVDVHKDQTIRIHGNRMDIVEGHEDARVEKNRTTRVGGQERHQVSHAANAEYHEDWTLKIHGSLTTVVGKHDAPRAYAMHAEGTMTLNGTTEVEITSAKSVVLRVGKSSLRLTPEAIELSAPTVHVAGKDASFTANDKLTLMTNGEAAIKAAEIKLKSKDADKKDAPPTKVTLVDKDGKPIPNQRYVITLDDGSVRSGATDKDGKAELSIEQGGTIVFPDLPDAKQG